MDFQDKADELGKKYSIARGKVYDVMLRVETQLKIKRPEEYLRNKDTFYRKTYFIANERLRLKQQSKLQSQSGLEQISNETQSR